MSKSTLAKLLATENLRVVYQSVQTASFNLKDRTITLPIWNDTTPEIDDLLIGHEVGHAIDTPIEYLDMAAEMPDGFRGFLNVIEDARIERLMKDRYPGIRRSFSKGYAQFMERDFFDLKDKDINKMLLIDRINVYFKVGPMFPVEFSPEEKTFVNRIEKCETFEDVKKIAMELFDYCKKELEEKKEEDMQEFQQRVESGEFDDLMEDMDMEDYQSGGSMDSDDWENGEDEDSDDESGFDNDESKSWSHGPSEPEYIPSKELKPYDDVKSATDESLQKSIQGLSEKKEIKIGKLPDASQYNFSNLIVSYKNILGNIYTLENVDEYFRESFAKEYKSKAFLEFETKNKNAIGYLVKEFEMKKRAAELRRVVISDTGVIDTNKLHTYKYNDDIFRKVGSISAGKNHGVMFFVDWSGSMRDNLRGTIEQLITLTTFCRKVNVPFEVYAFSTQWGSKPDPYGRLTDGKRNGSINKEGHIATDNSFHLLNLFSSKMTGNDYRRMANDLLNYTEISDSWSLYSTVMNYSMHLGGTPLNQTILAAMKLVPKYQKANRLEVMDVIFLTDGEDSSQETVVGKINPETNYISENTCVSYPSRWSVSYIEDPETNKKYRVGETGVTETFLRMLKDKTGCNLLGFYILDKKRHSFERATRMFGSVTTENSFKEFKNEKYFEVTTYGYDKYFLVPGGADLIIDDESLEDIIGEEQVSNRKLKGAFLKMNRNRLINRVFLSKTIDCMV